MHPSVMDYVKTRVRVMKRWMKNCRVLELGSMDVNGTVRSALSSLTPREYVGVDTRPGLAVDIVMDITYGVPYEWLDKYDLLVCTETLEHVEPCREFIYMAKRCLRAQGHFLITTRAPGFPYHAHPHDYWRFTPEQLGAFFSDFEVLDIRPDPQQEHPGVFLHATRPARWTPVELDMLADARTRVPQPARRRPRR